jgi:UDP-GlcNAc:undecaprenyl-phosphate GlcNAc-1-phosphate transferase
LSELDTNLLLLCVIALVSGLLCGALAPAFGRRTGLVDRQQVDEAGRPISRAGGTALLLAWCVALSVAGQVKGDLLPLLGFGAGAWLVGLHDDFTDSSPRLRVLLLAGLAVGAAWFGLRCESVDLPGLEPFALGAAAIPLSALWIFGTTVAFDFIDGLDGLALCLGALAAACFVFSGAGGTFALAALTLAAAQLGLLAWNRPPASFYLGDNGSNLLGFSLGALSVGSMGGEGGFPVLTALLLLAVPIADAAGTILRRARGAGSLFDSDLRHLHHRALEQREGPLGALAQLVALALAAAVGGLSLLLLN